MSKMLEIPEKNEKLSKLVTAALRCGDYAIVIVFKIAARL
jgi:hypothetical protein